MEKARQLHVLGGSGRYIADRSRPVNEVCPVKPGAVSMSPLRKPSIWLTPPSPARATVGVPAFRPARGLQPGRSEIAASQRLLYLQLIGPAKEYPSVPLLFDAP